MLNRLEKNAVDEFRNILSHWISVYKYKLCSYFANKTQTGARLVFGHILYETESPKNINSKFHIETNNIIAGYELSSIETKDVEQLLSQLEKGMVSFSKYKFDLKSKSGDAPDFMFYPIYPPAVSFGPRLPSLSSVGKERHDFQTVDMRMLDWELKSYEQPFDSIDDLLLHIRLPRLSQIGDYPRLEIWARSPAHISNTSSIKNGQASIVIDVFKNLDVNRIKLGCKVFNKKDVERFSICGEQIGWTNRNDSIIGEYKYPVEDAAWLQAFLSYEDVALHGWFINDPQKQTNPRYSIHSLFDVSHDILQQFLLQAGYNSENFEDGVALLLNILGFSIFHYGQIPKLKDGPDIIAFTPMGNIAVIECTIGLLDKEDKLAKLIQRTVLIKDELKNAGLGHFSIQPIIVSKLSRAEVTGHLEEAGKHSIAVVCKEELEELFRRASFYSNPDGLFQEASRLIPKNEQLSLPDLNNK